MARNQRTYDNEYKAQAVEMVITNTCGKKEHGKKPMVKKFQKQKH